MKIKTRELTGAALNFAVAMCENVEPDEKNKPIWFGDGDERVDYSPSTNWAQSGPIIEREFIELRPGSFIGSNDSPRIFAAWSQNRQGDRAISGTGPTPLIAACRCYVASKLGDEVEIPWELK